MAGSASRYARAVFELAREEGAIDDWSRQLALIRVILTDPTARAVLDNPTLPTETRVAAIDKLDLPGLGPEALNLMRLLVGSGRSGRIEEIVAQFEALADEAAGRVQASVTTAVELSEADLDRLRKDLSVSLGKEVRLAARVDPAILGGLVLQVGDRLTDASLAARLDQVRRRVLAR